MCEVHTLFMEFSIPKILPKYLLHYFFKLVIVSEIVKFSVIDEKKNPSGIEN